MRRRPLPMIRPAPRPALLAPPLAAALRAATMTLALSVPFAHSALAQVGAPTGVTRPPSPAAPADPAAAPP
ncbi:2-oxoglutarate dehydrogenase, E2 component, dihydrolipoamide succinyltransferase, partial [Roseomonas aerophila]|nr:2-oxoglutarate dehydrogenase, E2 component, dihydrolipoamide succinyltransferase [Pseudoroseomonas aerophila]